MATKPNRGEWTRGCLACRESQRSFHHAGADVDRLGDIVRGGEVWRIREEAGYRLEAVARCSRCGALWRASYGYPGKPPLMLDAEVIEGDEQAT